MIAAPAKATCVIGQETEALLAAGHVGATNDRTGFFAGVSGTGVIVTHAIDEHAEGHFDSPAHHEMQARAVEEYRQALEAAGWAVLVDPSGEGLTVTGRAKTPATQAPAVDALVRLQPWADDPDLLPPF